MATLDQVTKYLLTAEDRTAPGFTSASSGLERLQQGAFSLNKALASIGVGVSLGALTAELAQTAATYQKIAAQIRLVSGEGAAFATAMDLVTQASINSGASLEATATLYVRLYQATRELGLSQAEVAAMTETVNKTFAVSGASTAEAEGAIRQLAQALASGVLRGDEFNSVMEQSPRLSQALAEGLGVPIGKLREMAQAGKLTADVVINALRSQVDAINTDYAKLPETIGKALEKLSTNWTVFVGKLNETTGATQGAAEAINAVAENLDVIAEKAAYAGEVVVAALAIKAGAAVRAYIVEVAAATTATGALATASTALAATWTKLAPLLRTLAWAAVAVEVVNLTSSLIALREEQEKHPKLSKDIAEAQDRIKAKLAEISLQTGVTVGSMEEFNQAVTDGRIHFDEAALSWKRGAGDLAKLNNQITTLTLSGQELADSYKVLIPRIEAAARAQKQEYDVTSAGIRLAIEEQRTIYEVAKAKGDDATARAAKMKIVELEIQQARASAQADLSGAEASLTAARAKLAQAEATGANVGALKEELRAAELRVQAAKIGLQIVDEQAKRATALAKATDRVSSSNAAAAGSFGGFADGADEATASINALADAEQRLLDIRNAANAARGQGGATSWEYLLGKKGIELTTEQLREFKAEIESIYKYLSGTFDGQVVSSTYLIDEAIRRAVKLATGSASASTSTGGSSTTTTTRQPTPAASTGGGISITIQGDVLDADGLARKLKPALDKITRLRS